MKLRHVFLVSVLAAILGAAGETKMMWNFDRSPVGKLPPEFSAESGKWVVFSPDIGKRVLSQTAKSPASAFNVVLLKDVKARDLTLRVKLRAIAGKEDQGGGLVWRALDGKNYYLARFNPLENNLRLYTVVAGKRTQLENADVKLPQGWQTLAVHMKGDHITVELDGKQRLDAHDTTFSDAGTIGLWSKSDAQTQFDDLTLEMFD
jgi:hypothetical protein